GTGRSGRRSAVGDRLDLCKISCTYFCTPRSTPTPRDETCRPNRKQVLEARLRYCSNCERSHPFCSARNALAGPLVAASRGLRWLRIRSTASESRLTAITASSPLGASVGPTLTPIRGRASRQDALRPDLAHDGGS